MPATESDLSAFEALEEFAATIPPSNGETPEDVVPRLLAIDSNLRRPERRPRARPRPPSGRGAGRPPARDDVDSRRGAAHRVARRSVHVSCTTTPTLRRRCSPRRCSSRTKRRGSWRRFDANDFHDGRHRLIFEALRDVVRSDGHADVLLVRDRLREAGKPRAHRPDRRRRRRRGVPRRPR